MGCNHALLGNDGQLGEIIQDGAIQVQFSFVMQLETSQGNKGFGDGPYLEQMIRRHRFLRFEV